MTRITQEQAINMMNEIALAIMKMDVDKYMKCTDEQAKKISKNTRTAFESICEILGIEEVEKN